MADLIVDDIEEDVLAGLELKARNIGQSLEDYVRRVLTDVAMSCKQRPEHEEGRKGRLKNDAEH